MSLVNWTKIKEQSPVASEDTVFSGRTTLYTDYEKATADNIIDIIDEQFMDIYQNYIDIKMLKNYEKGLQPIWHREKEVRSDINNKVVINHAHEFKEFKKGFIYAQPITYVQRAKKDIADRDELIDDGAIAELNEMCHEQGKTSIDLEIADEFCTCGLGYKFAKSNTNEDDVSAFEIYSLPSEYTFIIYRNDIYRSKFLAGTFVIRNDGTVVLGCYSDELYFELEGSYGLSGWVLKKVEKNGIGMIPIVEYKYDNQKRSCFEPVIPILNELNNVESDRVNGVSQFVQSLLWLNNCKMSETEYQQLLDLGCVQTDDVSETKKASIQYLTAELNQTSTQTLVDDLHARALQIVGAPDRDQSTGGNTGQAIMLSGGWTTAETQAQSCEDIFKKSEKEFIKLLLKIINNSKKASENLKTLKPSDIDIEFGRNRTDNLLTKTQGLQNMLEAGLHPRLAFECCGLFADVEQAYIDSIPYLKKWAVEDTEPEKIEENVFDNTPEPTKNIVVDPETGTQSLKGEEE